MPATFTSLRRAQALLGTFVEIEVTDASHCDAEGAVEAAFSAVADVHRLMSFHEAGSDLSRLNRTASRAAVPVHPWTYAVLEMAVEINRHSAGAFDIGVAPALQRIGQLPGVSQASSPPAGMPTMDAIELLADNHVRFRHPAVLIDLGGIAKGFAVDRAIEALQSRGVGSAMVNAGGDLAAFGPEARVVHIRDPRSPDRPLCQVEVRNQALASSARRFDPFQSADTTDTAVIEPKSQMPARAACGATVRASSCMVADALTKVVMVAGKEAGGPLARFQASAIFVSTDGDIHTTSDWWGVLQHAA
jgi:thiamine biosynthesis lipoprotein